MSVAEIAAENWYEATRVDSPQRPRLTFELDVDVCVVGAGLAGLTVAREVARRGWSVAVLEAGHVAWAASGRNTGFVLPGFHEDTDTMIERIGLDHTRQLWALSEQGVDYVRRTIEETGMPGVDPVPGWLHVSKTDGDDTVRANVERMRWIGAEVEAWPTERVRSVLPNPRYFGAMHFPRAFHIHPLNYALGLAADAEKLGVRIFEDTPALSIDPAGVRKRIATPNARVRAPHVVLAGNVHLGAADAGACRHAAADHHLRDGDAAARATGQRGDPLSRRRSATPTAPTTITASSIRTIPPDRGCNGRAACGCGRPIRAGSRRGLKNDIRRNFPKLGYVGIDYLWSGTLGRAIHRMPQIGEIERGLWVASAFGGHGLNTTAMAGELIARGIVENDETWRMFAPYELVWAGGRLGRAVAQGLYWGSRPLARAEEGVARYREYAQARKAARVKARAEGQATGEARSRLAAVAAEIETVLAAVLPKDIARLVRPEEGADDADPSGDKPRRFGRRRRKKPK